MYLYLISGFRKENKTGHLYIRTRNIGKERSKNHSEHNSRSAEHKVSPNCYFWSTENQ